jgi:hypothetical protein
LDASAFLDRYPEFNGEDNTTLVDACLAEVEAELDVSVYGARFDEAHGALTAHRLWSSAFGVSLRQDGAGGGKSKYLEHFDSIKKAVTVPLSMMVI